MTGEVLLHTMREQPAVLSRVTMRGILGPEIRQIDTSSVEVSYVGPSWLAGGGSDECVVVMGWVGV